MTLESLHEFSLVEMRVTAVPIYWDIDNPDCLLKHVMKTVVLANIIPTQLDEMDS